MKIYIKYATKSREYWTRERKEGEIQEESKGKEETWNRNKSKKKRNNFCIWLKYRERRRGRPHHGTIQWFIIRNFTKPCPLNDGREKWNKRRAHLQVCEWEEGRKNKWQDVSHSIQMDSGSCRTILKTTKILFSFLSYSNSLRQHFCQTVYLYVSITKPGACFYKWWLCCQRMMMMAVIKLVLHLFVSPQTKRSTRIEEGKMCHYFLQNHKLHFKLNS